MVVIMIPSPPKDHAARPWTAAPRSAALWIFAWRRGHVTQSQIATSLSLRARNVHLPLFASHQCRRVPALVPATSGGTDLIGLNSSPHVTDVFASAGLMVGCETLPVILYGSFHPPTLLHQTVCAVAPLPLSPTPPRSRPPLPSSPIPASETQASNPSLSSLHPSRLISRACRIAKELESDANFAEFGADLARGSRASGMEKKRGLEAAAAGGADDGRPEAKRARPPALAR